MRRKIYTRELILQAAYEVMERDGFSGFTARSVADQLGVSTQPIYLEFKNMQDLKKSLIEKVYQDLEEQVFSVEHTDDKLVDMCLNYIDFAKKNPSIFMALFLDERGGGKFMYDISFDHFKRTAKSTKKYEHLSDRNLKALHIGVWVTITGMTTLMSAHIMQTSRQEVIETIQQTIDSILTSHSELAN
ncbi:MAG TPA: TetR/AcrR family transcriptional regulator [Candidatus Tetragenococcus pullicola]|nr:TetR/AcrR family transcriptional regulator [Candidatus Tetragenococcus pullicola]